MKKFFLVLGALVSTSAMAGLDPSLPMNVHTPTVNWSGMAAVMNAKRALREQEANEQLARQQQEINEQRARQEQEMNDLRIQILKEQLRQTRENAGE